MDVIVIEWPARLPMRHGARPELSVQNLWTFFCRMHNLSDTPGVGNLPASSEPEMEGGPLPQNLEFKLGRDAAPCGVRAYNASNGGVRHILPEALTPFGARAGEPRVQAC